MGMASIEWIEFPALKLHGIRHAFSRRAAVPLTGLETELELSSAALGFAPQTRVEAQQPHGNGVACVREIPKGRIPDADALVTQLPGVTLAIRVADCGPVYFYDPVAKAIGLAHSGKKGTALNIAGATISAMQREFSSDPRNLIAVLGPCIRPPYYEEDFAAQIAQQVRAAGVEQFYDCGICTGANVRDYYSYRMEKGQTGWMWALLMLV
jgi:copper oxidase (laccase) domain-containing protein